MVRRKIPAGKSPAYLSIALIHDLDGGFENGYYF